MQDPRSPTDQDRYDPSNFRDALAVFISPMVGRGIDLVGASCQHFHKRFPRAQMRAEYTGGEDDDR